MSPTTGTESKPANLAFLTQYRSSVPNLKHILMKNWHLIQQQPLLRRIIKDPPLSRTEGADP